MTEQFDENGKRHRADGPWRIPPLVWCIHGHDISNEVNEWMAENDITWPWDTETQMIFDLRFVHIDRPEPAKTTGNTPQDIINRIRARQKADEDKERQNAINRMKGIKCHF